MRSRTKMWLGRLAEGLGVATLLALAGCYATARPGVVYTAEAEAPVYYEPAPAQVYVEPPAPAATVYVHEPPPPVTTVYVQPAPPPPTTVYVGGVHRQRAAPVQVGPANGRRQRPVVVHQGGVVPAPRQGRGEDDDDDNDEGHGHGHGRGHGRD